MAFHKFQEHQAVVPRWRRPQPHMRHCAGRGAVVRWLASEGAWGAWGLKWPPLDPSGPTIAAPKAAPMCLKFMLRVFE